MPDGAKFCVHCEASVEKLSFSSDELKFAEELLRNMPDNVKQELRAVFESSSTADDFVNRIFVGDCPSCGSSSTSCCEDDPDIDNPLVGRCLDCSLLWCTECGSVIPIKGPYECSCWDEEIEGLDENEEFEDADDFEDDDEDVKDEEDKAD
jgi:hypothetical protein